MSISITNAMQAQKLIDDRKIRKGSIIISVDGMFQVVDVVDFLVDLKEIVYDEDADIEQLVGDYHWTCYDLVKKELAVSSDYECDDDYWQGHNPEV